MALDPRQTTHGDPDAEAVPQTASRTGKAALLARRVGEFFHSREPRLAATLPAALGVLILLGLGTWQMLRLGEKNTMLAEMAEELTHAPADLRALPPSGAAAWKALHYRPVLLRGTWLALHPIRLAPRTYEGQAGYQLLLPLRLGDGQVVLVDRGFVLDGAAIAPPDDNDMVQLSGVARLPEAAKPRFMPENIPARGEWVWLDMEGLGHEIGVGNLAPVVVYEDRVTDRDAYPIGGQLPLPDHNRHRQYALTWYAMALALIGVWLAASRRPAPPAALTGAAIAEMDPVARRGQYPEATD